jgi:mannose/cellobiose epimerase-like protein (N-acyl-D-glucosamine 2-epimerase family)
MNPSPADFENPDFLRQHIERTLAFYEPTAFDPQGGFFHYFLNDGQVYNRTHRHLVSATRFVFNWVHAFEQTGRPAFKDWARHGLAHIDGAFKGSHGLWVWTLQSGAVEDARVMAYGQAFVLLAKSCAYRLGLCSLADVADVFDRMNEVFYDEPARAYADEWTPGQSLDGYRGQNANMHMCEACIAAFEATGEARYLARARSLIQRFAFELADEAAGQVWEHYDSRWHPDWNYNKDSPGDIFKPWGFQTGHQTEWAKLLLQVHAHQSEPELLVRAMALHQSAWRCGWDAQFGGLIYGYDPQGRPCDEQKYFWVQAESLASAWRLWRLTGRDEFRQQYHQLWDWSWRHMVDHTYGAWFRVVHRDGSQFENTKSPAGKTDYHTMGACWDILRVG